MSDETTDLLRIARENYGWVGVCLTFTALVFKPVRSGIATALAWWRRPGAETRAIQALVEELRGVRVTLLRAVSLAERSEIGTRINDVRTRILMRESSVPRWECDEHGHCDTVNDALCALFERPRDNMLGTRWTQYIEPGQAPAVMAAFRAAYAGVNDYEYVHPYAIVKPNGTLMNIIASSEEVLRDESGKVIRMWGKCRPQPTLMDERRERA